MVSPLLDDSWTLLGYKQHGGLAPGWPQLRSRLPFGPRSQASLQKAQGPGICGLDLKVGKVISIYISLIRTQSCNHP